MDKERQVTIVEVGPRDGLQFEKAVYSTGQKVALINALTAAGLGCIEATSFINPKFIPALADAAEVMAAIDKAPGVIYSALAPNLKGCLKALETRVDEITLFVSASEAHNQKNVGMSREKSLAGFKEMARLTLESGRSLRGYVITAFGCPYEGRVPLDEVRRILDAYRELGVREASLGDTTGMANPIQTEQMFRALLAEYPEMSLAAHFHDSRGLALTNSYAAWQAGVRVFDSSIAGLGGCPAAVGAAGNAATEDLVNMFHEMDLETGIDYQALLKASALVPDMLGCQPASRCLSAGKPIW